MDTAISTQRLGQQIRVMRLNRGYKQADLAKRAGVTRQKLVEIEKGSPSVSMNAYARVIAALGSEVKSVPVSLPTLDPDTRADIHRKNRRPDYQERTR